MIIIRGNLLYIGPLRTISVINMVMTEESKFSRLRKFNGVMAVVHFIQAVLILVLANNTSQPIYSYFLKFDPATQSLVSQQEVLFNLPLGPDGGAVPVHLGVRPLPAGRTAVPLVRGRAEGEPQLRPVVRVCHLVLRHDRGHRRAGRGQGHRRHHPRSSPSTRS